jgi:hypothetical protein
MTKAVSSPDRSEVPSRVLAREAGQLRSRSDGGDPEQVEHTPLSLLDHGSRQVGEAEIVDEARQLSTQPGHSPPSLRKPVR